MKEPKRFLTIGGDLRQVYTTEALNEKGYIANAYGFDKLNNIKLPRFEYSDLKTAINDSDAIILPLPVSQDGVTLNSPYFSSDIKLLDLCDFFNKRQIIFGGMIIKELKKELSEKGILFYDYFEREELIVKNAVPTAQGVIKLIMDELPITVHGSRIGITGYGRTARVLAGMLKGLGAEVLIAARNYGQLAFAEVEGCKAVTFNDLDKAAIKLDILINTVPAMVIDEHILSSLKKDCLIIEIASAPWGIDFDTAKKYELHVIKAGSLPGKAAPKTAGEIISEAILNIIKEEIT